MWTGTATTSPQAARPSRTRSALYTLIVRSWLAVMIDPSPLHCTTPPITLQCISARTRLSRHGDHAHHTLTQVTDIVWPESVYKHTPRRTSQTRTVPSLEQLASLVLLGFLCHTTSVPALVLVLILVLVLVFTGSRFATYLCIGSQASPITYLVWPLRVLRQ